MAQADLVGGLAAEAVSRDGEGAESTPLAVLSELDFIDFVRRYPTPSELKLLQIAPAEDLFAPFLESVQWRRRGRGLAPEDDNMKQP